MPARFPLGPSILTTTHALGPPSGFWEVTTFPPRSSITHDVVDEQVIPLTPDVPGSTTAELDQVGVADVGFVEYDSDPGRSTARHSDADGQAT